jgi:hypothetical protein
MCDCTSGNLEIPGLRLKAHDQSEITPYIGP